MSQTKKPRPSYPAARTAFPRSSRGRLIILGLVVVATAIAIIAVSVTQSMGRTTSSANDAAVVRENSHVLDEAADGTVTLVEFLDFECEACGAFYPYIEQFREDYAGQVTFVTRYFPIPGHQNSRSSAIAVESAAQQGKFEEMYQMMFETQLAWGESQDSKAALFRTYAEQLDLDMAAFDSAVAAPATLARVLQDYDEGLALGVRSTPTFFLSGEPMTIESIDDFKAQLDAALAK